MNRTCLPTARSAIGAAWQSALGGLRGMGQRSSGLAPAPI